LFDLIAAVQAFARDRRASLTTVISLAVIPLTISLGVAVDLSRTLNVKSKLQAAMDAAVISGVNTEASKRDTYATAMFVSQGTIADVTVSVPAFVTNGDKSYSGAVTAIVPMSILTLVGKNSLTLNVTAKATAPVVDDSCILSFGRGQSLSDDSLTLNGASNLNLTGCKLRSNTSMKCNGHSGNADASYAAGSVGNKCANPYPNSPTVTDIHAALASNISRQCGLTSNTLSWPVGTPPSSPNMITIVNGSVTEYHVCGTVTLSGTGTLLGNASSDSLLVIENGSLILDKNADITLTRTAIVMTGTTGTHTIEFPNGNGKSATLRVAPGTDASNPWRGIGIYQDPALTTGIDINWGPGANLHADGVLYFGNANVTMSGNMNSGGSSCTKLITSTFTSNGAVALSQSTSACSAIGLTQYKVASHLSN